MFFFLHAQGMVGELQINALRMSDVGNYTCRVDFLHDQTRMAMLTLDVHSEYINRMQLL